MRKTIISALMISLLLLCGCGSRGYEVKLENFRATLEECSSVSFVAEISVQDADSVADFTVECTRSGEKTTLRLLEPKLISDVTAHLSGSDAVIEYDGLSFDSGIRLGEGLTPIEAPDAVLDALQSGLTSQFQADGNVLAFQVERGNGRYTTLRLELDTMTPTQAEIYADGRLVIRCAISDWHME